MWYVSLCVWEEKGPGIRRLCRAGVEEWRREREVATAVDGTEQCSDEATGI